MLPKQLSVLNTMGDIERELVAGLAGREKKSRMDFRPMGRMIVHVVGNSSSSPYSSSLVFLPSSRVREVEDPLEEGVVAADSVKKSGELADKSV